MEKRPWPTWTVVYNIQLSKGGFVGKGWEFFDNEDYAEHCRRKQIARGNIPTMRPFHPSDKQHMNLVDIRGCSLTDNAEITRAAWSKRETSA